MTRAGKTGPDGAWPEALLASVRQLPAHGRLYVALSGGMDSVLLLHTVARLQRDGARPAAIHVNHQLQPNAAEAEHFCWRLCQSLGLACHTIRVSVPATASRDGNGTGGLEQAARQARYQAFKSCLGEGDLLLMAHHRDDQAETVLFRLIRGTGVAGLGGMPVSREVGSGWLYRPFLGIDRAELEAWAKATGIAWVEDPSNSDPRFDRNFLRQSILPALRDRWPFLNRRLAATARACGESGELADSLARIHLARCATDDEGLDLSALADLSMAEQKNLVRWWVRQRHLPPPETVDWPGLLSQLIGSAVDRQPEYLGPGYALRRHRNRLYLVTGDALPETGQVRLEPGRATSWDGWRLRLQCVTPAAGSHPRLQVNARQGGERIRVRPNGPSRPLKKWLQEQSVPTWERNRLPLVTDAEGGADSLVAVGHLWVSERYSGEVPGSGWRLIMERDSN